MRAMLWGASTARLKSGSVALALLSLPACGLVVGFTPRDFCEDCELASGSTSGSGGAGNAAGPDSTNSATAAATTSSTAEATTSAQSGGGAGGTSNSTAANASSTDTSSTDSSTTTASGGSSTSETSSGGTTSSSTTSSGGTTSTSDTTGTTTSGGNPSTCEPKLVGNATNATGTHPAALAFIKGTSRAWGVSWLDADDIYYRRLNLDGSESVADTKMTTTSGARSAPLIASVSGDAAISYGELVSVNATVAMTHFNALAPTVNPSSDDTGTSSQASAPLLGGIASSGAAETFLVGALEANGMARLAVFTSGSLSATQTFGSGVTAIAPAWLGATFGAFFVAGGQLQLARALSDLSSITPLPAVLAFPGAAASSNALAAAATSTGAVVAWVNASGGISLASVDSEGALDIQVVVSTGAQDSFPQLSVGNGHIAIAWLDAAQNKLYFRRFATALDASEDPLEVASGVAEFNLGLALDDLTTGSSSTYALVYNTDRLKFSFVTCSE